MANGQDMSELVVCRCENLTWGEVEKAIAAFEPSSLRQLKLVTRWGMGICQGRVCRPMMAAAGMDAEVRSGLLARLPFKPINLGELSETGGDEI